jgi:hypothetical protein
VGFEFAEIPDFYDSARCGGQGFLGRSSFLDVVDDYVIPGALDDCDFLDIDDVLC